MLKKFPAIALLCGATVLAGCDEAAVANLTNNLTSGVSGGASQATSGKTSEELQLEREVSDLNRVTRNIVFSNTAQGIVLGTAAGCIAAEVADDNCVRGGVIGGVIGGIFGNQVGREAAQAKRDIVSSEEVVQRLQGVNQQLNGIETDLQAVVRKQNSEIASLRRQLDAGQVSQSSVDARIAAINSNRQTISTSLAESEQNVVNERAKLVTAERESGQSLTNSKRAADSTRSRLQSLRGQVRQVSS